MNLAAILTFFADRRNQRWTLYLVLIIALTLLLGWAIWLYFDWKVHQVLNQSPPGANELPAQTPTH